MLRRLAPAPVVIIAGLGALFVGLDMIDVLEIRELGLPLRALNTVFFVAVVVPAACLGGRSFAVTARPQALWLGLGVLAFGAGSLLYAWIPERELNVRITTHESAALIASALHLSGSAGRMGWRCAAPGPASRRLARLFLGYLGVAAFAGGIALLAATGMIPLFHDPGGGSVLRDAVRAATTAFFVAASLVYLRAYRTRRSPFVFWYASGLMLFAVASVLIPLSAVDGAIAWIGRAAQYAGGIYFVVAAARSGKP